MVLSPPASAAAGRSLLDSLVFVWSSAVISLMEILNKNTALTGCLMFPILWRGLINEALQLLFSVFRW